MNNPNSSTGETSMTLDQLLAKNGIKVADKQSTSTSQGSHVNFSFTGQNAGRNFAHPSANSGNQASSSVCIAGMIELANRTIVVFRNKTSSTASQNYFSEWILKSFNLPEKSIKDISQISTVQDYYVVFIVLSDKRSLENILAIYRSTTFNANQFIIIPASEILVEGTIEMRRQQQKQNGGKVSNESVPNLNTCLLSLLGHNLPQTSSGSSSQNVNQNRQPQPGQLDSNRILWENIAAAVDQLLFRLVFKLGKFSLFLFFSLIPLFTGRKIISEKKGSSEMKENYYWGLTKFF
ncbi:unnamed protein product [Meloidogyne enterolobii]|uniref:Uncharacterized protein n=1 Tax=Meloidogyne enterolobii TaxID=390850 RepID=A0ACB0YF96_MELEN